MDDLREWLAERWQQLLLAVLVIAGGAWWWRGRPLDQPPGVLAAADPIQTEPESKDSWSFRGQRITPLAAFELQARVLGVERYRFDRAADLSPVDLALGWGPMSDSRILDAFQIRQRDRWYFWQAAHLPIAESAVITHSANMHMIPADRGAERRLLAVRPGQLVALRGKLVRVDGPDGWHWVSSLTRSDTGDGSCEVVWVDSVSTADRASGL